MVTSLSKTAPRTSVSRLLRTPGPMGFMDKEAYFAGGLGDVDQQHVPATGNVLLGHEADPAISRMTPPAGARWP